MFDRLKKENIIAGDDFNRWRIPPASIAVHICIGSVYAWSMFNIPLTQLQGVVAPAAGDWSLGSVVWIFSVAIVFLGSAAAVAGKWLERVGPRMVGVTAAMLWGGGFIIGSIGILMNQLWLVYLGYGAIGGCGLGLGYVSPVSTLIRWFPDRRGMATGMAIMGFGGGAMIGGPLKGFLLNSFQEAPQSLGLIDNLKLITENGVRFVDINNVLTEVVVSGGEAFIVGTGSTGIMSTFLTLGIGYFVVMIIASMFYRLPKEGWKPKGWKPPAVSTNKMITESNVHIDNVLKTPQFWFLWVVLCMNVSAGIGVISAAKNMISDIFGSTLPDIVDGVFASTYVVMISVFNMCGRFFWASVSDFIGRKMTYMIFFILGMALYLFIPYSIMAVSTSSAVIYLVLFYAASMIIFTMYGGGFATIPAYLADIFGVKFVGAIHGRLLTAWSIAGVLGPLTITQLRKASTNNAIEDLVTKVDSSTFETKFGAPLSELPVLIEAKTVTIKTLMEIVPPGTIDPTSTIYNTTIYTMAGLLLIGLIANIMIKPVDKKYHI